MGKVKYATKVHNINYKTIVAALIFAFGGALIIVYCKVNFTMITIITDGQHAYHLLVISIKRGQQQLMWHLNDYSYKAQLVSAVTYSVVPQYHSPLQ